MSPATTTTGNEHPQEITGQKPLPFGVNRLVALQVYRDLGTKRSIGKLRGTLKEQFPNLAIPSLGRLRQWARDENWDRLCAVWDKRAGQTSPHIEINRQLLGDLQIACASTASPSLRDGRNLLRQVERLFASVLQMGADQERQQKANQKELEKQAPTTRDLIALIEKARNEEKAAGTSEPALPDMLALSSKASIKTAQCLSRALGRWAYQVASPGLTRRDAGTATDLLALRETLDQRILEFEGEQNRRRSVSRRLLYPDLDPDAWIERMKANCDASDRLRDVVLSAARRDRGSLDRGLSHVHDRDCDGRPVAPISDREEDWGNDEGWSDTGSHDTFDDEGEPADDAWDEEEVDSEDEDDSDCEDELGLADLVGRKLEELPEKYRHAIRPGDGRIRCVWVGKRNGYVVLMVNTNKPAWITVETGVRCR